MEGVETKEVAPNSSVVEDKSKIHKRNGWDYGDSNIFFFFLQSN